MMFSLIPHSLADNSSKLLNLQDNKIQFTAEYAVNNILPFLDLKVIGQRN